MSKIRMMDTQQSGDSGKSCIFSPNAVFGEPRIDVADKFKDSLLEKSVLFGGRSVFCPIQAFSKLL